MTSRQVAHLPRCSSTCFRSLPMSECSAKADSRSALGCSAAAASPVRRRSSTNLGSSGTLYLLRALAGLRTGLLIRERFQLPGLRQASPNIYLQVTNIHLHDLICLPAVKSLMAQF